MFDDSYNGLTVDEAAARAGGYVAYHPGERPVPDYDIRALNRYCRERGVEPFELSKEELDMFRLNARSRKKSQHNECIQGNS